MSCDNCLCHLNICNAECCREFSITLLRRERLFKGKEISWICNDTDLLNYYALHGLTVKKNIVTVKLKEFIQTSNNVKIFSRCTALSETNLCTLHNTDKQPKICAYPNKTGTGGKVYLTPNCIYKKEWFYEKSNKRK